MNKRTLAMLQDPRITAVKVRLDDKIHTYAALRPWVKNAPIGALVIVPINDDYTFTVGRIAEFCGPEELDPNNDFDYRYIYHVESVMSGRYEMALANLQTNWLKLLVPAFNHVIKK